MSAAQDPRQAQSSSPAVAEATMPAGPSTTEIRELAAHGLLAAAAVLAARGILVMAHGQLFALAGFEPALLDRTLLDPYGWPEIWRQARWLALGAGTERTAGKHYDLRLALHAHRVGNDDGRMRSPRELIIPHILRTHCGSSRTCEATNCSAETAENSSAWE